MATRITDAAQNAAVNAVVDLIDVGAGANGTLEIRTGAQPADADDADAGTLLCTVNLAATAYGAAASGSAALAGTPLSGTAGAAGTAGHFRVKNKDGTAVFDGDITATGGGGDLELDNTSIANGQTVNINSLAFSIPASE